jgi:hypothetical protein
MDTLGLRESIGVFKSSIFDDPSKLLKLVWPELKDIVEQIDRIEGNSIKSYRNIEELDKSVMTVRYSVTILHEKMNRIEKLLDNQNMQLSRIEERMKQTEFEKRMMA